ncbi:hypothetical protein ACFPH8_05710 [Bizionia hallyeonensis]|uniref:Uncharacterized protein n=1 Tax=Bizionia hallyeonensis TaxID=1123757 RepID=A0ABW0C6E1_9FLAO
MDKKSQVFNTIRDNLFKSYIFYVPKQFYHYIEPTFIANIITSNMVNIIAYSNLDRNITTLPSEMNALELLGKGELLNDNLEQLLEQQESLSKKAFKRFLDQYLEHAGMYWVFSLWMSKNVGIDLPESTSAIQSMFELQHQAFDKHLDKLDSYFGEQISEELSDPYQYIDMVSDVIEDAPIKQIETPVIAPEQIAEEPPKIEPKELEIVVEKEEKEPLMTNAKARNFLLESVFGIGSEYLEEDKID